MKTKQAIDYLLNSLSSLEERITKVEMNIDYPDEVCTDLVDGYKTYPAKFTNYCTCKELKDLPTPHSGGYCHKCHKTILPQDKPIQPKEDWCECKEPNWLASSMGGVYCGNCEKRHQPKERQNGAGDIIFKKFTLQPMATKEDDKELRDEIRTMLFVHPLWNGKHKDTNELADKIIALIKE